MSLSIENVTKQFGDFTAVSKISLTIEEGEFIVLLGPSGCGKSTLLRMVAGLENVDDGRIRMGGRDLTPLEPAKRDLAMVFQSYALYPHMTVGENIGYPLRIRKVPGGQAKGEVLRVAEKLGLGELLHRRPRELSGGQRQRVALARAMVRRPRAFLMDEPLSNLDARLRVQMRAELKHLHQELKTTTLYVTHDQSEAMTLARRIAVLDKGRLLQFGTPQEIYRKPVDTFVAGFVGSPAMNLIQGSVNNGVQFVGKGGLRFPLPFVPEASAITLGFRPEDVEISVREQPGYCAGTVYVVEELGDETFVILESGDCGDGVRITARVSPDFSVRADQALWFRPRADRVHVFDGGSGLRISPESGRV